MAQHVKIAGASYANVPAVKLPLAGGGEALFMDASNYRTSAAQDIIDATKAEIDLLWTNSSPNSNFPAQTISLSLSSYMAVVVVCQYDASSNYCVSTLTPVGSKGVCTLAWGTTGTLASRHYVVKTTGIAFEGAYVNNGGAYSDNMMPTHIYGIKGVQ